jgi:radical SAM superfamily enzyme YgiQ (UPF0313 family)
LKVYLLNPPYFPHFIRGARWQDTGRGGTLYYPIWLSYAAANLEQFYTVRLVDAPAWDWDISQVIKDIKQFKPSFIVIDSSFPSLNNDIDVAKVIKENYSAPIVFVGPPTSQFADKILQSGAIDIVARMEYDFTLLEIAQAMIKGNGLQDVLGISYFYNGNIKHNKSRDFSQSDDLDKIPFVTKVYKNHLKIENYFLGSSLYPEVQIFTGRGCPNLCTFCSWPSTLMGRKYRVRSISNVLDELEWIEKNLPNVKEVFFEDDTFTVSKKRVLDFCQGYKQRKFKIAWACNARATLDYETMVEMKKSGCRLLIVGYESGNNNILKKIKKGINTDDIRKFAKNAKKANLLVHGDFIIGLPGETKDTIKETINLIFETRPEILQLSVASPFPGTEFYEWAKTNKFLLTDDPNEYLDENGHQKAVVSYPWLDCQEITKTVDKILKKYYISIYYVPLVLRQIFRKNGIFELRRIWYSAKMFLSYSQNR